MLLRGCQLRNTDWALGIVVSTGTDAKINFTKPGERSRDRVKVGHTMQLLNRDIMGVAVALTVRHQEQLPRRRTRRRRRELRERLGGAREHRVHICLGAAARRQRSHPHVG